MSLAETVWPRALTVDTRASMTLLASAARSLPATSMLNAPLLTVPVYTLSLTSRMTGSPLTALVTVPVMVTVPAASAMLRVSSLVTLAPSVMVGVRGAVMVSSCVVTSLAVLPAASVTVAVTS